MQVRHRQLPRYPWYTARDVMLLQARWIHSWHPLQRYAHSWPTLRAQTPHGCLGPGLGHCPESSRRRIRGE